MAGYGADFQVGGNWLAMIGEVASQALRSCLKGKVDYTRETIDKGANGMGLPRACWSHEEDIDTWKGGLSHFASFS